MRIRILLCFFLLSVQAQFGFAQNSTFMRLAKVDGLNFGLSFTETSDGGMIGTGQDDGAGGHGSCDLYLHKIDECGETQWYKRYGGPHEDGGKFVTQLADGGYAVGGLCASSGAGNYDNWLLRLDGSGNLLWSKTFGAGAGDHGRCVAQAPNGDILFSGFRNAHRPVMYRVDLSGNIVWQKEFDLNNGICNYVEFFPNGDILAIGDFVGPYGGRDVFVARLDGNANLLWAKQLGTAGNDGIDWDVAGKIGSGDFILSATMSGFGTDQDMTMSKFTETGNLIWRKRIYGAGVDKCHFINQTDDGGYIQSGTTNSWGFGDFDIIVNRFDPNGNHLWTKIYGGVGIDKGWGVQQTSDNGYLLSTLTTSFGALYYDPMFIKTDSVGGLVDCPNFQSPPANIVDANYSIAALNFTVYDVNQFTGNYSPTVIDIVPDDELVCFSCVNEPQFIISDSVICEGESLYLINQTSVGLICSQEWYIEDSLGSNVTSIAGADTAVYSFSEPGYYNIVLNANCGGIVNADTVTIWVLPKPKPGFEFEDACVNEQPVTVTDTSAIYPVQWQWDFGDGSTGTGANAQHVYADSGYYDIQLVVTNYFQCTDTVTQQIRIHDKPTAAFSFNDTCFGGSNNFVDLSIANEGVVSGYYWDFGDSNTDSQQNPSHTYTAASAYSVQLVVTTDFGCSDTIVQDVDVYVLPQADFVLPNNCINDPMPLDDASTDGDWTINSWTWNIDDGSTLSGSSVNHLFATEGDHQVQLTVVDQFGCSDSIEQTVTVHVRPDIDVSVADDCEDEQFPFQNNSTIGNGIIDSVHWDVGDGTTYTVFSPTHIYTDYGVYDVVVYMESEYGCDSDTSFQVEVFPNPTAAFQWSNVCDDEIMPFQELSSVPSPGQLLPSDWTMGDGNTLNDTVLTGYQYADFGAYPVQLNVETQHGCTDQISETVYIHPLPEPDFSFANICETDSVLFSDQSSIAQGSIVLWQWDFGNGQTHTGSDPSYQTYPADGFYPVSLTTTSDSGCVVTLVDTIEVYPTPIASFTFDSVCYLLPISYTDLSDANGAYPITQWVWEFSDGQSSTNASPQVTYLSYGAYSASLTVTNQAGCKDVVALGDALVHPLPTAEYQANLGHCLNDTLVLTDESSTPVLSDDALVLWQYDLGDGSNALVPNYQYVYSYPGFYDVELEVTTNHDCSDTETKTVEVYPLPEVSFDADPKEGCEPLRVQFTDGSSIPSPYVLSQWQWDLGDSSAYPQAPSPFYVYDPDFSDPFQAFVYDISLTVTSTNGCVSSSLVQDMITVHPVPDASFSTDPEKLATMINPLFEFTDESSANVVDWNWAFGDGQGSALQNPQHTYADSGTYKVRLIVETTFGCLDTISYTVKVEPYFTFYIPDAFTPNSDRYNDSFYGQGTYIVEYTMQIFNRWGEMIFESNQQDFRWDGTFKGQQVESGQYVYKFRIIDWEGHDHEYVGKVMLLR